MLSVEDWAEIRRLHFAEKLGTKTIAKRLGVARNTVRTAIRSASPPAYQRARQPSALDPYEPAIRKLLKDFPTMPSVLPAVPLQVRLMALIDVFLNPLLGDNEVVRRGVGLMDIDEDSETTVNQSPAA